MQAVIMAAGRGKRMRELTENCPKPMLKFGDKNLLEHKLDILPPEITEVIMVVHYQKEKIIGYFGDSYKHMKIRYVEEPTIGGTGKALWVCQDCLRDKFIVMMGDDIYGANDIELAVKEDLAIFAKPVHRYFYAGNILINEKGYFRAMDDEPGEKDGLLNTGLYVLDKRIFEYELQTVPGSGELGLPQTIVKMAADVPVKVIETHEWRQITAPEDLTI